MNADPRSPVPATLDRGTAVNETLPLCPDTELDADTPLALSESVEVGPFPQGVVFVSVPSLSAGFVTRQIGLSPTGYEDWDRQWTVVETFPTLESTGMYARRIENLGNWLRVRSVLGDGSPDASATVLAWFLGGRVGARRSSRAGFSRRGCRRVTRVTETGKL